MPNKSRDCDPILDELHAIRRKMHDDCGGKLSEIVARMRERQERSGHPIARMKAVDNTSATRSANGSTRKNDRISDR